MITLTYLDTTNNNDILVGMTEFILKYAQIRYINDPIDEGMYALINTLSAQSLPVIITGDLVITSPQNALRYLSRLVCSPPISIKEEIEIDEWTDRGFEILRDELDYAAIMKSIDLKLQSSDTGWIMNTVTPCKADFLWGFVFQRIDPTLLGNASKKFIKQFDNG